MAAPKKVVEEVGKLREQLAAWDYHYYVLDDPLVTDTEWDAAFNRLKAIEAEHPELVTPDSPTQRVGGVPIAAFDEVPHPVPMLSLDNAMGLDDLGVWHERLLRALGREDTWDYVAEPKIDGLALELIYQGGALVQGATRGDGVRGEDVTANVRTVRSVPLKLREPVDVVVRGEAFMTVERFAELNERQRELGDKEYQNPRNATAGAVRQLDARITASRPIEMFVYTIVFPERYGLKSHWESMDYLRRLGFRTNPASALIPNYDALLAKVQAFADERHKLNYWADGLVIKVNPLSVQEAAGWTARAPRWALAYKYPPDTAITTLLDVEIGVGRTGALTPTAQLDPVRLGGTTVKAASLHNWDEIDRLGVMIGDQIEVQKAGEVIPQVLRVFPEKRTGHERPIPRPEHCPVCGSAVMQEPGKVGYRCVGLSCRPQLVRRLEYFTSRPAMRIEGLGIKLTERFFDLGWLKDVADIYHLHEHTEEMRELEGFGETSTKNLFAAIEASKTQPLWKILTAVGIPGVGPEVAKTLEAAFGTSQRLEAATEAELSAVTGIGPILAHDIAGFFNDINNSEVIVELRDAGLAGLQAGYQSPLATTGEGPLTGKTVVVTGSFADYTRSQLQELIGKLGGKAGSSVSKKTDLVLIGVDPGSKADKAHELGVPTVEGDEALRAWMAEVGGG